MKSFLPILLFGLLIFNMIGFSVYNITGNGEQRNVSLSETNPDFILKIPVTLPYATNWESDEPAEGELIHDADYYDITAKQMMNDTLFVKCRYKENARDRFWNLVSTFDDQMKSSKGSSKNQSSFLLKNLVKEYMASRRKLTFYILEWKVPAAYQTDVTPHSALPEYSVSVPPPDKA